MSTPEENGPGNSGENPFKGTPFESLFAGGVPDLQGLMAQVQSMMQPYDGPVNWDAALDTARRTVAQQPDPSPDQRQKDAVADAVRLADHWLDATTDFTSGTTTAAAWSRAEWIVATMDVWKVMVEPLAARSAASMGEALPEEARAVAGPMLGMIQQAMGSMVAHQIGQGLGTLAGEVLGTTDIGLPLVPAGRAALVTANVAAFAEGLDVGSDDVLLYLALREAAHQRLFANVGWLRDHLIGAVTDYARGIDVDVSSMEEKMRSLDPTDPAAMAQAMEGGLFQIEDTPAQKAALERLEVTLALVEGWVDEVVGQATEQRMPAAAKLAEAMRRRRAAGGPAEQAFATLVGLELRPRRLRDAATLWGSLRTRQGTEGRDGVWMSPQLLPTAADLDDPLGFREDAVAGPELSEEDFDAGLRALLDEPGEDRPTEQ